MPSGPHKGDAQRDRLTQAGAIRVFTDVGSGKRFDRPGLAELLEIVANIEARGVHFVSLEERLDTSSAAGELVFHMFGVIAHFEQRLISERTRDGIAAARKRGRTPGRPPLDPETVSAAQKLIEAGLSPARAAKPLAGQRLTESQPQRANDVFRP